MYNLKSKVVLGLILASIVTLSSSSNSQENVKQNQPVIVPNTSLQIDTQVLRKIDVNIDNLVNESKEGKKLTKSIQIESERVPKEKVKVITVSNHFPEDKKEGTILFSEETGKDSITITSDSTYIPLNKDSIKYKSFWTKVKGWFSKSK